MSVGAAITRGVGAGCLALAAVGLIAAIVAAAIGDNWVDEGQRRGNDDQAEAGVDLMVMAGASFGASAGFGALGGFLFFLGSSLLRRYEARARQGAMPPLPDDAA